MRQTELRLSRADRVMAEGVRAKGVWPAREVNRAHILLALDRKVPEAQIMAVLGVGRMMVWRTRAAYLEGGLELALRDVQRSGRPRMYGIHTEARVAALACSQAPEGSTRWTVELLHEAARAEPGLQMISRETVRRLLKKTVSNLGAR
jgi:transposase